MIKSMTGFGRACIEYDEFTITTEIRSVNHRFTEVHVRMPRQLTIIEDKVKRCVTRYIKRGKADVWITVEGETGVERELTVDWGLMDQYVAAHERANERYNIQDRIRYHQLLTFPDIVSIHEKENVSDEFAGKILESVEKAASELSEMRAEEGKHLREDLNQRLTVIEKILNEVESFAPDVQEAYKERLYKRIKSINDGTVELDEDRILTEVAIFADKCSIDEELIRLKSHLSQFRDILGESEPVGRKLDFLVQEMNRESNTIGSKGNDYSINKNVVQLKSEIEKIKEQVQNIE
ncbi:YicC/YloC family endoribonuclease [Alkalihalobacillus sp. TS-13]|uniref:YicC/YloC family endoribonuclease n=1 Tax=Alkalihalobacillus sp. TS-13 TaxID=2842455 RepID=UPI001C874A3F|nr:YicC/YloC family endoribonuclease [Alkalihalobacillus sp. TS-13]